MSSARWFLLLFSISWAVAQETRENGLKTDHFSVVLLFPEKIFVPMEETREATFEYLFECDSSSRIIEMTARSRHESVFTLSGNVSQVIFCEDSQTIETVKIAGKLFEDDMHNLTVRHNYEIDRETRVVYGTFTIFVEAKLLGLSELVFTAHREADLSEDNQDVDVIESTISVTVFRKLGTFDVLFQKVVFGFIILITLSFGCKLNIQVVKECLRKPVAPGIGLACQYVLMPLLGFTVSKLLPIEDDTVAFGIFLCGICPGGGVSNMYTYLLDGDVDLSITMTFVSTLASLGLLPFWLFTLGRVYLNEFSGVVIPFTGMISTLATVSVPLVVGLFLQYKFKRLAKILIKIIKPVSVILILVLVSVGIYANFYLFKLLQPIHIVGGCLLPYFGYLFGGTAAFIFRQPLPRIKAIALETGMQNVGIAFLLLISSFPVPIGDLAAVAPVASSMMTPIPPFIVMVPYLIYKRCHRKNEDEHEEKGKEQNKHGQNASEPSQEVLLDTENLKSPV